MVGGTSDYNALANKPAINSIVLAGNLMPEDLGLIQKNGEEPQKIETDLEIDAGKHLTLTNEDGTASSSMKSNEEGKIFATVTVGEEIVEEQVAYVSDIDKKVTAVLGGAY